VPWLSSSLPKDDSISAYLLTGQDVRAELDLAKGALSQRLDQYIVANSVLLLGRTGLPRRPVATRMMGSATLSAILRAAIRVPFLLVRIVAAVARAFHLPLAIPGFFLSV